MEKNTSASRTILFQDLGILLFMLSMLGAALITGFSEKALIYQQAVMMLAMMFSALLTVLRARVAGTVLTALTLLAFTAYKLYNRYLFPVTNRSATCLPSTSPANASWTVDRLIKAWIQIKQPV